MNDFNSNNDAALERQPGTNGIWTFVFIDMIVFSLIFLVFVSERLRLPELYAEGQSHLKFTFGLVNTLLLLTSSMFMALAVADVRVGAIARVRRNLIACLICGSGFAVNKVIEYHAKFVAGYTPASGSFFSFYYFITGAHFLHVLGGMVFISHCLARVNVEGAEQGFRRKLENTGLFWHFVDLLWLFIFPLLYLSLGGAK